MTTTIAICSGKGGTGKTIITACLGYLLNRQKKKVLLIDADVSVRGLSALLYVDSGQLRLTDGVPFSSYLTDPVDPDRLGIESYRGLFHVLPSCGRIDDVIRYEHLSFDPEALETRLLRLLRSDAVRRFDYVLIDARAGVDVITTAVARVSEIVCLVGEEDDISAITTANYKKELDFYIPGKKLYSITNKSRKSADDSRSAGFDHLGFIPFDLDVVNSYGTSDFWGRIDGTNFLFRLATVWNQLADWEALARIPEPALKGVPIVTAAKVMGQYSLRDRMTILMGATITIGSFLLGGYSVIYAKFSSMQFLFLMFSGLMGVFMLTGHLILPKPFNTVVTPPPEIERKPARSSAPRSKRRKPS
jgi:septum site-determining protein MinD